MQKRRGQRNESLARPLTMKQPRPPPFPLIFGLYCICAVQFTAGFPQPFAGYLGESDIPTSERLALCFSQWTELSDQPQISSSVMDLCNSMFNGMQVDEEHKQEVFKRFLFHYSRAQDPTYPLKAGSFPVHPLMRLAPKLSERRMKRFLDPESSVLAAAEFTKKDGLDGLGRPFFLFRPRNGRTVNNGGE
ncbi:neuromedin-S isoform X1 [Hemicordylus capensis]|uniref:neuromedin-S isoform X1 n=1 Tax=Hemicordylus capensis TaxID=884348 RepID=UPI0023048BAE|nr:neuromedin-S isoform X1 [Hemicordylus capensis]